jgi:hypothetical protein
MACAPSGDCAGALRLQMAPSKTRARKEGGGRMDRRIAEESGSLPGSISAANRIRSLFQRLTWSEGRYRDQLPSCAPLRRHFGRSYVLFRHNRPQN